MAKKVYLFSGNYLEKYHLSVSPTQAEKEDLARVPFKVRNFNGTITRILSCNKKDMNLRVITFENGLKIAVHPFDSILTDVGYVVAKDIGKYKHAIACKTPFAHTVQKESTIPKEFNRKLKRARGLYDFVKSGSKEKQTELAYFLGMVLSSFTMDRKSIEFACRDMTEFQSAFDAANVLGKNLFGSTPLRVSDNMDLRRFRFQGTDLVSKLTALIGKNLKRKKTIEEVQPDGTIKKTIINKAALRKIPAFVKDGTREEKMAFVEGFLRNYTPTIVSGKIRDDLTYLLLGLGYNVRFKGYKCYLLSKAGNAEDVHFLSQELLNTEFVGIPAFERVFIERQMYGNFTSSVVLNENGIQAPKGLLYLKIESIETTTCSDIYAFETDLVEGESFMNYGCAIRPFGA